jgi:hypothetical protein
MVLEGRTYLPCTFLFQGCYFLKTSCSIETLTIEHLFLWHYSIHYSKMLVLI